MSVTKPGFRTPLRRARGLGAAKHGVGDFIGQRASAVALVILLLWGVWAALQLASLGYAGAVGWLHSPVNAAMLVLLLAAGFYHVRIGMQVVLEDYLHAPLVKTASILLNLFVCCAGFVLAALSVLKVAFGAP